MAGFSIAAFMLALVPRRVSVTVLHSCIIILVVFINYIILLLAHFQIAKYFQKVIVLHYSFAKRKKK